MALTSLMRDPVHLQVIFNGVVFFVAEPRVFSHYGSRALFYGMAEPRTFLFRASSFQALHIVTASYLVLTNACASQQSTSLPSALYPRVFICSAYLVLVSRLTL